MSMIFGWRPESSCYSDQATNSQQPAACDSPTWWYWLMGGALFAGLLVRGRRKGQA